MNDNITIEEILDYCDEPLVVVVRDKYDTLYLAMLYDDESHYLTTKVSRLRLEEVKQNKFDLRDAFVNPENAGEYYIAHISDGEPQMTRAPFTTVPDDMLPESGYRFPESETETLTVTISRADSSIFKTLVKRFGWVAM